MGTVAFPATGGYGPFVMAEPRWAEECRRAAKGVRRRVLEHTLVHDGGYMSQACSAAELLSTLYLRVMKLPPVASPLLPRPFPGVPAATNSRYFTGAEFNGIAGPEEDRFFLSPAHYALVLYTLLIETGRMHPDGLADFNRDGASVEMIGAEHSPGMEVTAGSLGQCLSQAGGIALARRLRGDSGRTWVFMSDGEFQVGQTWEALQAIAHHRLDTVCVYVDVNGQQCDGTVPSVMRIEPLEARAQAFGWTVVRVDGHSPKALSAAASQRVVGQPHLVLCDTDPCKGLPLLRRNAPRLHYLRFKGKEDKAAYQAALESL